MTEVTIDQRNQWQSVRDGINLNDPYSEDYAKKGLASRVLQPSFRILIQPELRYDTHTEFDQEFWNWFKTTSSEPFLGQYYELREYQPTASAAVRFSKHGNGGWDRYIALHRNRTLEVELGSGGAQDLQDSRCFRLINMVGSSWRYLILYGRVIDK